MWLIMLFYWPARLIWAERRRMFGGKRLVEVSLFGLSVAFIFGASFFEPLMLYSNILVFVYFIVALCSQAIGHGAPLLDAQKILESDANSPSGVGRASAGIRSLN